MEENIPISTAGYALVRELLEELKAQRPEIIKAIAEAREEGDLSENAGYHAARERQGWLEARISNIKSRMPYYVVIDPAEMSGEKVAFAATVELEDLETGETRTFTLMGPDETDWYPGSISVLSPVGRALIGKRVGDEAVVNAPRGRIEYEVVEIRFEAPQPVKK